MKVLCTVLMVSLLFVATVSRELHAQDIGQQLGSVYAELHKSCSFFTLPELMSTQRRIFINAAITHAERIFDQLQDISPSVRSSVVDQIRLIQARYAELKALVDVELDRSEDSPHLLFVQPFKS